jgi:hypothetical protein
MEAANRELREQRGHGDGERHPDAAVDGERVALCQRLCFGECFTRGDANAHRDADTVGG